VKKLSLRNELVEEGRNNIARMEYADKLALSAFSFVRGEGRMLCCWAAARQNFGPRQGKAENSFEIHTFLLAIFAIYTELQRKAVFGYNL
jgi:hypothetical protein